MTNRDRRMDRRTALLAGAGMVGAIAELGRPGLPAEAAEVHRHQDRQMAAGLNHRALDAAMQAQGEEMKGGVYAYSLGRKDLNVNVEGIKIEPSFALAAEANFMAMSGGMAMVMGEIPLRETEVNGAISRLFEGGLQFNALHNHRVMMAPHVMWVHFAGQGPGATLAAAVRRAFPAQGSFDKGGSKPTSTPLPAQLIGRILGGDVRIDEGGVVEVSVDRTDQIRVNGMVVPPAAGVSHTIYFQPLGGGRAAISGEMPLVAGEVNPVALQIRRSNIQITALHNHMLTDQPHLFYMHTWAVGSPLALAQAHRAALDYTRSKRGTAGLGKG